MKNKNDFLTIILLIMLIFNFILIFRFSNQDADISSNVSETVTEVILKPITSVQKLSEVEKRTLISDYNGIVRKCAHFTLYLVVGVLAMSLMFVRTNIKENYKFIYSLAIGILYAVSDEIHQIFIPGRSCEIRDVIIDSMRSICWNMYYYCI